MGEDCSKGGRRPHDAGARIDRTDQPLRQGVLVLAGNRGKLLIVDAGKWKVRSEWKHVRPLFSLAITPDSRRAAAGDAKGDIVLWDLTANRKPRILQGHEWTVYGLAFTPDGRSLVSGSADGTVRLWDVGAGRLVETFRWHSLGDQRGRGGRRDDGGRGRRRRGRRRLGSRRRVK
jgi:WD40 repeat protein